LVGVLTITFLLLHFVPGDPVEIMLGEQASNIDKLALRHELGLDLPVATQLARYASGLLKFDLGRSLQSKRPVSQELAERIPATAELTIAAMIIALLIGIPLGVLAAIHHNGVLERVIMAWGLIAMSTPAVWLGPILILFFAIRLDMFPVSERGGLEHLVLPSLTLASGLASVLMQTTRASMLEVIREDYINVARAKGVGFARLYFRHALSNAIMPVITIVGLQFGALLSGTVIIETMFDWPGIGTLLFQAIQSRNYPLVQGCVLLIACVYVGVNLLTDLAYATANPRVRLS
jgi:peptide/nickel transport system permease protein